MSSFLKRDLPTTFKIASAIAVGALAARWLLAEDDDEPEATLPLSHEGLRDYSKIVGTSSKLKFKVDRLDDGSTLALGYSKDPNTERPRYEDHTEGHHFDVSPLGHRAIVKSEKGLGAEPAMTVVQLFRAAVKRHGPHTALISATGKKYTWQQYYDNAFDMAKALVRFGLVKGDSVNIIGFNSPEWLIMNIAAIFAGGKAAGVYTTNGPELCQYVSDHSQAVVVCCQDASQVAKYVEIRANLPKLKAIVVWEGQVPEGANDGDPKARVYTWEEFISTGRSASEAVGDEVKKSMQMQKPEDPVTLIYTSGTTGNPKAVMLSHDNVTWTSMALFVGLGANFGRPDDPVGEAAVSYLPLSHIAAQIIDIHLPLFCTALKGSNFVVTFADSLALKGTLLTTLQQARPTFFLGVPRVWEKFAEAMKKKGAATKGLKRTLIDWAKAKGLENFESHQNNGSHRTPWGFALASLLLNKVKHQIGLDRCKYACTAAAPIGDMTLNFFGALDIPVFEIYGMSECTGPHTASQPGAHLVGSTGPSLAGIETKIMHDASRDKPEEGEICYRGRHVMMGYMSDKEKTENAIDADGWLHSGDVGRVDNDGMLFITGRIKELLITAGGENIPPVPIEDDIKTAAPAISNVMVIGDKKKFLTALVTLKTEANPDGTFSDKLTAEALEVTPGITSVGEAIADEAFKTHVQKGLDSYNKHAISNAAKVQYFRILPTDFSIPGGELGPTLKLRRGKVGEKYADVIESMYSK